jgi:5,10-methylenetetrahydromethanopterin reductase
VRQLRVHVGRNAYGSPIQVTNTVYAGATSLRRAPTWPIPVPDNGRAEVLRVVTGTAPPNDLAAHGLLSVTMTTFGLLSFPLPGLAATMASGAEDAGWDSLHFADTQNLAADVYVSLGMAAVATSSIQLATGVTNPVTRHPAVTASAIASVQCASGGRAVLGIGRGDSSLGFLGQRPAAPAVFEQYLIRLRGYLHGETVDLDGVASTNNWIADSGQQAVPIDVAATGPKVSALAARLADRVTFAVGADVERLRAAIALVRNERASAGLEPGGISVGAYINVVTHPDTDVARALVRGSAASFAHFSGMAGAERVANDAMASEYERLGRDYVMDDHARAESAHASALSDEFLDAFSVAGPVDHCVARLSELMDLGLDHVVMVPGSRDADRLELMASIGRLSSEVLPRLR